MGGRISSGEFAGRLLQTFVLRNKSELLSAIGFSDDHGENWKLGARIQGGNETAIAGLNDGTILIHSRATPHRISGRSIDGGVSLTVLEPDLALPDPSDNGSLCVLSNGDVICSHNHDPDLRRNTVMKRSTDGGRTWSSGICIEADSSAYSTACELADGSIGVLYERNAYQEIVFAKFSKNEFQPIYSVIKVTQPTIDIEFTVVPRNIRPGRNQEIEAQLTNPPTVPDVDMNVFNVTERKEVGAAGGTTSGDPLYTADELERILGPIAPGLHISDEVRFSARIANYGTESLFELKLVDQNAEEITYSKSLAPSTKICLLDIRQSISKHDLDRGFARFEFELSGRNANSTEFKKKVILEMPTT